MMTNIDNINPTIKILFRRDTLENWNKSNPVLSQGELGFVVEPSGRYTGEYRFGDGQKHWMSLESCFSLLSIVDNDRLIVDDTNIYGYTIKKLILDVKKLKAICTALFIITVIFVPVSFIIALSIL